MQRSALTLVLERLQARLIKRSPSIRELSPEAQRPDLYLKKLLCVALLANPPRRNEAYIMPHRVEKEFLCRDTKLRMSGLVRIILGSRKILGSLAVEVSGLAETGMRKMNSCQAG